MSSRAAVWAAANGGALNQLSLSGTSLDLNAAATINISGATAGSTLTSSTLPAGLTLNSAARTITGTPTVPGSYGITITETLNGKANSPRVSGVRIEVPAIAASQPAPAPTAEQFKAPLAAAGVPLEGDLVARGMASVQGTVRARLKNFRVAVLDDSRGDQATSTDFGVAGGDLFAHGFSYGAHVLSNGRLEFRTEDNFGLATDTTRAVDDKPGFLSRLAAVLASGAGILALGGPLNNWAKGITLEQTKADILTMIQAGLSAGMLVVVRAEMPSVQGVHLAKHLAYARWVRSLPSQFQGVVVWDTWSRMADRSPSVVNGAALAGEYFDDVHPANKGAWHMAEAFYEAVAPYLGGISEDDLLCAGEVWSAGDGATLNLLANPFLTGTGGVKDTAGTPGTLAGTLPANTTIVIPAGLTVTGTPGSTYQGTSDWLKLDITGTSSAAIPIVELYQDITAARVAPGDMIDGWTDFRVVAGASGLIGVGPRLRTTLTGNPTLAPSVGRGIKAYAGGGLTFAYGGKAKTSLLLPYQPQSIRHGLTMYAGQNDAISATVYVRMLRAQKRPA